jgi:hypothetical protein
MNKYIVKHNRRDLLAWKDGVILEKDGCIARVSQKKDRNFIDVEIEGSSSLSKKLLFKDIRECFDEIHSKFFQDKDKEVHFYVGYEGEWYDIFELKQAAQNIENAQERIYWPPAKRFIRISEVMSKYELSRDEHESVPLDERYDLIKRAIKNDYTEEALEILKSIPVHQKSALKLCARLERIKKDRRDGVLTNESYSIERNRINSEILDMIP